MADIDTVLESWINSGFARPVFNRPQVAKLLNCSPLTIANRETKGVYPQPKRHPTSKHRFYTLQDVFALQYITYKKRIFVSTIASLLWDMGYNETHKVLPCLQAEINAFKSTLDVDILDSPESIDEVGAGAFEW